MMIELILDQLQFLVCTLKNKKQIEFDNNLNLKTFEQQHLNI